MPDRIAWVQVAGGSATINGTALTEGDGVAIDAAGRLALTGTGEAEILLFDMAQESVQ